MNIKCDVAVLNLLQFPVFWTPCIFCSTFLLFHGTYWFFNCHTFWW